MSFLVGSLIKVIIKMSVAKAKKINVKYHFDSIDILRGFAAISVVVYHVIEHFNWSSFPISGPLLWFRLALLNKSNFC